MHEKMYLIHEDDYIKHIDEKIALYSMVKQLTHHIARLAPNRANKALSNMSKVFDRATGDMFRSWGIPMSYLVFDNKDDLAELMENELIEPEEAGYFPCDCECCRETCEDSKGESANEDDITEMLAGLSEFIRSSFRDDVLVHIIVE